MLKKTITYRDFDDVEHTETFYFNISKVEVLETEHSVDGGYGAMLKKVVETQNNKEILNVFKEFILKAYGIKSEDGLRFIKSKELSDAFAQTQAYVEIYMELGTNANAAVEFVKNVFPKDLVAKAMNS